MQKKISLLAGLKRILFISIKILVVSIMLLFLKILFANGNTIEIWTVVFAFGMLIELYAISLELTKRNKLSGGLILIFTTYIVFELTGVPLLNFDFYYLPVLTTFALNLMVFLIGFSYWMSCIYYKKTNPSLVPIVASKNAKRKGLFTKFYKYHLQFAIGAFFFFLLAFIWSLNENASWPSLHSDNNAPINLQNITLIPITNS